MFKQTLITLFCLFYISINAKEIPSALKVETYTLANGLTIYLNEDHSTSSVMGMVAVKGGSKRDPQDATGIAHYFEHIMFKGTDKIGTTDYTKEKVYLDSIAAQYDKLGQTTDSKERETIQLKINQLSLEASDYAIPNEFDRIISQMGGQDLNAFTGYEYIGYLNSFPQTEMEKWLEIYSHRFENPVFRLFQSELETVYEEKNLYADNMFSSFLEALLKELYQETPYANPVIGYAEHLKNPSLSKMREYYEKYYVPNNMALILTGDFDAKAVKPMIEEKFGDWKAKDLPQEDEIKAIPFNGREQVNKRLLPIKVGVLGFRTVPIGHPDELKINLCNRILSNYSYTGLLDELVNDNELMEAQVENLNFEELGSTLIIMVPKLFGQSLKKTEKLILEKINKLKQGDFNNDLIDAVKLEMISEKEREIEDSRNRTIALMDAFVYNKNWDDEIKYADHLNAITKDEIIETAKKYYGDNYLAFYSKMGFPKKDKIKKPAYKPVKPQNTEAKSEYAKMIKELPSEKVIPHFTEEGIDFNKGKLNECAEYYTSKNPINDIFSLNIKFHAGTNENIENDLADEIISYCGTKEFAYSDFKKELQKLGADFYANANGTNFTLHISGLEKNFNPTLKLINDLITDPVLKDSEKIKLIRDRKMNKKMMLKDLDSQSEALDEYALYKTNSYYLNDITAKQIKTISLDSLIALTKNVFSNSCELHYCGNLSPEEFKSITTKQLTFTSHLQKGNRYFVKDKIKPTENEVFFINDKNAVQSHISLYVISNKNDTADYWDQKLFNEYFSGDMSSLVFQEIREFKSLAYSAYGYSQTPFSKNHPSFFTGIMSTQADKTIEALETYVDLINNMPQKPERMDIIKESIKQSMNSKRPGFRNITNSIPYWQYVGCDEDPNKLLYSRVDEMNFDHVLAYYNKYIKDKKIIITIVGDKKRIDFEKLHQFGNVKELDKKDVFN
ncbi:M16 family metallopeptidase [Plebeiibacterium sediminum]|uniref:Insulinase family protein n=1 Tax=Plebeiibacterium sediminum TaxID=2992112 RepID=A0AAE3M8W2_9BACT|nr:M16 family metallopeptidase [Plebeiobacterium sediminum]MCW3788740.1 insulinase family protein [Plebeiobacterium sediminum]